MQKAIIDTNTGVVKRLTIDESPYLSSGESIVIVDNNFKLDGFIKLDSSGNKTTPSQKEIDDSGVDEARNAEIISEKRAELKTIIEDIADKGATLNKLQTYFQALKNLQ